MSMGETPAGGESKAGDAASQPSSAEPAILAGGGPGGGAAGGWPAFDPQAILASIFRILKDPTGGLQATYRPGQPALMQGLVLGVGTAVLIPLVQLISIKIQVGSDFPISFGNVLKAMAGGALYLVIGAGLTLLVRAGTAKGKPLSWQDDLCLFGSPMVFLLAGVIVGAFFDLLGRHFVAFSLLAPVLGLVLSVFTYWGGLVSLAKLGARAAVWSSVLVFAVSILFGAVLGYHPAQAGSMAAVASYSRDIEDTMKSGIEEWQKKMNDAMKELPR